MPRLPFRKSTQQSAEPPVLPESGSEGRRLPSLIVLTPLVAGVTSFNVDEFPDSTSAREHLQSVLESELGFRRGLTAFWALQNPPPELRDALDPVVLVRSPDRASIACPYFFVDATAAQSYAWTKITQGIAPESILIYLALIVNIAVDEQGVVSLSPAHPPVAPKTGTSRQALGGYELGSDGVAPRHPAPAVQEGLPRRA